MVEEIPGDVVVLRPGERLDLASAPALKEAVHRVFNRGASQVVLDLSAVAYVSSIGVGACLESAKLAKAGGARIALSGMSPEVAEVFTLTGVHKLFEIHGTTQAAISALTGRLVMTLPEEILLLALHDEGGRFVELPEHALDHAVVGATLLDLCLHRRLDADLTQLVLADASPVGDDILDPVLEQIAAAREPRDTASWIKALVLMAPDLRERALDRLVRRGILERKDGLLRWFGGERRYPVVNGDEQREVKLRALDLLRTGEIPTPHDVAIISLADACAVFDAIVDMDEMLDLRPRIAEVARMDLMAQAITKALRDAHKHDRLQDEHLET